MEKSGTHTNRLAMSSNNNPTMNSVDNNNSNNNSNKPTKKKKRRTLDASISLINTADTPRRSEKGEGSILDFYDKARAGKLHLDSDTTHDSNSNAITTPARGRALQRRMSCDFPLFHFEATSTTNNAESNHDNANANATTRNKRGTYRHRSSDQLFDEIYGKGRQRNSNSNVNSPNNHNKNNNNNINSNNNRNSNHCTRPNDSDSCCSTEENEDYGYYDATIVDSGNSGDDGGGGCRRSSANDDNISPPGRIATTKKAGRQKQQEKQQQQQQQRSTAAPYRHRSCDVLFDELYKNQHRNNGSNTNNNNNNRNAGGTDNNNNYNTDDDASSACDSIFVSSRRVSTGAKSKYLVPSASGNNNNNKPVGSCNSSRCSSGGGNSSSAGNGGGSSVDGGGSYNSFSDSSSIGDSNSSVGGGGGNSACTPNSSPTNNKSSPNSNRGTSSSFSSPSRRRLLVPKKTSSFNSTPTHTPNSSPSKSVVSGIIMMSPSPSQTSLCRSRSTPVRVLGGGAGGVRGIDSPSKHRSPSSSTKMENDRKLCDVFNSNHSGKQQQQQQQQQQQNSYNNGDYSATENDDEQSIADSIRSSSLDDLKEMLICNSQRNLRAKPHKRNSIKTSKLGDNANSNKNNNTVPSNLMIIMKSPNKAMPAEVHNILNLYSNNKRNNSDDDDDDDDDIDDDNSYNTNYQAGSNNDNDAKYNHSGLISDEGSDYTIDLLADSTSSFSTKDCKQSSSSSLTTDGGFHTNNQSHGTLLSHTTTDHSMGISSLAVETPVRLQRNQLKHNKSNISLQFDNNHGMMSCETLPITNVVPFDTDDKNNNNRDVQKRKNSAKMDQIIESLVWFSFHLPRTVLEDLISHELELWRKQHTMKRQQQNKKSNKSSPKSNSKHNSASYQRAKSKRNLLTASSHRTLKQSSRSLVDSTTSVEYCQEEEEGSDGSVSSLSDHEGGPTDTVFDTNYSEKVIRRQGKLKSDDMIVLPKAVDRESAILFCDMSGFTKLSTMLDVESLSKVINSYFEMIVSEVLSHGGDILKFAGDAFFAEWKITDDDEKNKDKQKNNKNKGKKKHNPLSELNASLASINDITWDDDAIPPQSMAVLYAAKCATSIVQKFSDYHVTTAVGATNGGAGNNTSNSNYANGTSEYGGAMLNVHCGVGVGQLVGLHVGDYKENEEEEEATELRREFLILGDPIDQVSKAADIASDGEVLASPEAMLALAFCCDLTQEQQMATEPICIASRDESFLAYESYAQIEITSALQPYESLRMHCKSLTLTALARLNLQMALYVHPVIRGDELALSAAIQAGKISQPTETLESRHIAEAELRSVFTMFIMPLISPRITGIPDVDQKLFKKLSDIMHVTSRELDRYSGHLRQFIVDDKGVVLIATFGLRGSTFPNMVENNGLPAATAIHRCLKSELGVENRIGCTFGKVYCGVVGGVRRHEFAVMGAPVNLAARLMASKVNSGILVDEAVREHCIGRYSFKSLPPVSAKGYDKPVPILEPIQMETKSSKKKKSSFPIIGRKAEKRTVLSVARGIIEEPMISQSTMIFLTGESGMGKSALATMILEELKKTFTEEKSIIVTAKSTSTETEQRIPLSSFRKVFLNVIRERCEYDENGDNNTIRQSVSSATTAGRSAMQSIRSMSSMKSFSRRGQLLASHKLPGKKGANPFEKLAEESMNDLSESSNVKRSRSRMTACPGLLNHTQARQQNNMKKSLQLSSNNQLNPSLHGGSQRTADSLSQSLHRMGLHQEKPGRRRSGFVKAQSVRLIPNAKQSSRGSKSFLNDCEESTTSIDTSFQKQGSSARYFEKLCWACEKLEYPYEYADIVGSQFLGFESATPITHVDGHVPTMDELVEFFASAFIILTEHADLTTVFLDDFHWVDGFSWRIFRVLCKKAKKLILMSATRSHDKQALRRMTMAATQETQLQSHMIEISLGPLDFSEIRELMATVLEFKKSSIPDLLCTDIFQRTGGLPVYVVQVLENIKRKKTVEMIDGILKWTAEGLIEKKNMATNKNGAVMEETFLSRFDALDVRIRKVLQTCAVLGLSFSLTDVIKVHPEMEEFDIENALETAMDEMILMEQVEHGEDHDDDTSTQSGSLSAEDVESRQRGGDSDNQGSGGERYFQFSHAMWRKNVLATMLKERKMELHRLIAEAMERNDVLILEQSDISRLLTLFDHWKSCGEFCKVAPLALAVGSRLEEWDLAAQSLELYEDALEMAIDGVHPTDQETKDAEWVQVKGKPIVLDLILRLHICMGMCHQRLGQDYQSILYFQDAYYIIKSASKMSGMSEALVMPIISSLCVLILEQEATDPHTKSENLKLVHTFVREAEEDGDIIHIGRSLALLAVYSAKHGDFRTAVETLKKLEEAYDIEENSEDMVAEYGRDYAIECASESVQWKYLMGNHDEAEALAETIINSYIPLLDPADTDQVIYAVLPLIQVFSLLDRAEDADLLLKKYIINPYHDYDNPSSDFWAPLFNPLAYLLEIIIMDDQERHDQQILDEMEDWVLNDENYQYDAELERKANTVMGELCWRIALLKDDEDESQAILLRKARELLEPVAFYPHSEIFQKQTAQALLEAL